MLRAMHEWISDSDCTPHIVVDATMKGVDVPRQYVRDGKIVLNLSWNATGQLSMGGDEICFNGRFGGAFPAPMLAARPGHTYPELIVRLAGGERIEPHVGDFEAGVTFSRWYWQVALDEDLVPTGREIVPGGPRPVQLPRG